MIKRNLITKIEVRSVVSELLGVLTGLLVLAMLLITGTWAWQSFNQQAFTPSYGHSNFGGRLHDDYDGYDIGTHNRDIYAENFGEHDLYVRVQLREYLALGGTPVGADPSAISINDPSTWSIYNADRDLVTTRRVGTDAALIGAEGIEWAFGGSKIFMPTFNQAAHEAVSRDPSVPAPFDHDTAYQMTSTTGNAVDGIANGFDIDGMTSAADFLGGYQTGLGDGSRDYWRAGETRTEPVLRVDDSGHLSLAPAETHTAKSTLSPDYGGIMTMMHWRENGKPSGNFWVLDTENEGSWFYWAMPLAPGDATSLLLDKMTIHEQRQDWEYVMIAVADFATVSDVRNMPDLSGDAKDLWGLVGLTLPPAARGCAQDGDPVNLWTDSIGVEWCVVADEGDYAMLVSRRAHSLIGVDGINNTRYHSPNEFVPWEGNTENPNGPEIRSRVNTWFNANSSVELRENVVNGTVPSVNDPLGDTGDLTALSMPVPGTMGSMTAPFFLSPADLNVRLGNSATARQATFDDGRIAIYWTRIGSVITFTPIWTVDINGNWRLYGTDNTSPLFGVRPALWVRRQIES